jgi:hypothetical protein
VESTKRNDIMPERFARKTVLVLVAVFLVAWTALPARAQEAITVVENEHQHTFQGSLTFRLSVKSGSAIESIKLFYRVSGQTAAHKVELEFEPGTVVEVEYVEDMSDDDNYQPPMITFTYWWTIVDVEGHHLRTDPVSFVYLDTRYEWDALENDHVRLYWHDQPLAFGKGLFDAATRAAAELGSEFGVIPEDPVSIVIYNSHEELMSVLQQGSSEWTGAVNFGTSGCIAIGLGSMDWMEKVIPHELTHAMLNMITKPPFGDIPRWLHEGLAVRSEGGMDAEEALALAAAVERDELIPLRALNSPFPDQREQAILSYAESNSLVSFIIEEYGAAKLGELIAVFAEGAHYDDAMMEIFGVDMDGMEDLWRASVGAPPRSGVSRATPVPQVTRAPRELTELGDDRATPMPTVTLVPQETPLSTPAPRGAVPCLGAAPALALLAVLLFLTRFGR